VSREIDRERLLNPAVANQIIERDSALSVLKAVDNSEAAVVADDNNDLVAGEDRRIDVRVHHKVGAVAKHHKRVSIRVRHCRAPSSRDFVAHGEPPVADQIGFRDRKRCRNDTWTVIDMHVAIARAKRHFGN
jgi:hypothetical protein